MYFVKRFSAYFEVKVHAMYWCTGAPEMTINPGKHLVAKCFASNRHLDKDTKQGIFGIIDESVCYYRK